MRGGRLCRLESSDQLFAEGIGPEVVPGQVSFESPTTFVNQPMVIGAQPGGVFETRASASSAEDDVVELVYRVAAAGEGAAAAVALVGGAALGGGELVVGLADVEDFTFGAEHHRDQLGIAGESARGFG